MNRKEIRDDVRQRISETSSLVVQDPTDPDYDADTSGGFWKDSFINRKINEGYHRFMRARRWSWSWKVQRNIPVAAGNPNIELIDDVEDNRHGMLLLTDASGRLYAPEKVEMPEAGRLMLHFRTAGEPRFYFVADTVKNTYEDGDVARAQVLTLIPTPAIAYTAEFHYMADPADLTADDQEPDMPRMYHEALAAYAAGQCFKKELNSNKANEAFTEFYEVLEQAVAEQEKQGSTEKVTWGRPMYRRRVDDRDWYAKHIPGQLG